MSQAYQTVYCPASRGYPLLIFLLLFEKIKLANVLDVDSCAKKKGAGVDGES